MNRPLLVSLALRPSVSRPLLVLLALPLFAGCPDGPAGIDAGLHPPDAGSADDAGPHDGGPDDGGQHDGGATDGGGPCQSTCTEGDLACDVEQNAPLLCVEVEANCFQYVAEESCGPGALCASGSCVPCDGAVGSQSGLTLEVDGETRSYFLHVPAGLSCETPAPLWMHFHGTAGPQPELAYHLEDAVARAEVEGAILVRPRSRSSLEGGQEVFRWDQNPGDLPKNVAFGKALVASLKERYPIDEQRVFASGFSSGANMTAQFLGEPSQPFSGLAPLGGGLWADIVDVPLADADSLQVYAATGYRDYLHGSRGALLEHLDVVGFDLARVVVREGANGHEIYDWHFTELWNLFARSERPAVDEPPTDWTAEPSLSGQDSVLALTDAPDGDVVAVTAQGGVYKGDDPTSLDEVARFSWAGLSLAADGPPALTDVCIRPDGAGYAVGEGFAAATHDGGDTWEVAAPIPEVTSFPAFGVAYLNGLGCDESRFVGAGYWVAVNSQNGGLSWEASSIDSNGFPAQVMDIVKSPVSGSWVSVGSYTIGRSTDDGNDFIETATYPTVQGWLNDVAVDDGGVFYAVGDSGLVLRSENDGLTWTALNVPAETGDLYTVALGPGGAVAAAGMHGTVIVSTDGGVSFETMDTGRDAFVGALTFGDDGTLYALGRGGAVFSRLAFLPGS